MAMNWPTFFKRLGSAVIFCILMLLALLNADGQGITLKLLLAIVFYISCHELGKILSLIQVKENSSSIWDLLLSMVFMIGLFTSDITVLVAAMVIFWLIAGCFFVFDKEGDFKFVGGLAFKFIYLFFPLFSVHLLSDISALLPLAIVLMLWTNDTLAYLVGSFIGKTPFSKISPKKTVEGTLGGILLTIGGAGVYGYFSSYYAIEHWIALAVIVAVVGTIGDLFESRLKRMAGIKDSGSIMPGHGGALDRFDSLLFAAPLAYAYCSLMMEPIAVSFF